MRTDLPRRPPASSRFRRWWQRRLAWRRPPTAPLAAPDSWREGHGRRSRIHRYHAGLRRWPRRALIGVVALVLVVILLGVAAFAYAFWRYHELDRVDVSNLVPERPGSPFDVLIVGTTPANEVASAHRHTTKLLATFILLARVDPRSHEIRLVAIPPQTEVAMAAGGSPASETRPISEALEGGPGIFVQTVVTDFHVPITDYLALKVSGIRSVVGALGGIHLDFAYPLRDAFTGLSIDTTGCQLVSGAQAQALFESRHLYYFANGAWRADLRAMSSAIAREDAVFAATITSTGGIVFDPVELNNLVSSVVANLTVDHAISESGLLSLAETFRGFSRAQLASVTLPAVKARSRTGAGVTAPATRADDTIIARFLSFGTATSASSLLRSVHIAVPSGLTLPAKTSFVDATVHLSWNPKPC